MNSRNVLESKDIVLDVDKNSETETIIESTELLKIVPDIKADEDITKVMLEPTAMHIAPSIDHHQHLEAAARAQQQQSIQSLFDQDPKRVENFSIDFNEIHVDFSKHRLDVGSRKILLDYVEHCEFAQKRAALFAGEKINTTEKRAVLHMALRGQLDDHYQVDQQSVMPEVLAVREKCFDFAESVRSGEWSGVTGKQITTIVNIGIGGSDLGPQLIVDALFDYIPNDLKVKFISRLDSKHVARILKQLDPETTLFVVVSKTFTTLETIENAKSCRAWLIDKLGTDAIAKHFVGVSTNLKATTEFGINPNNVFGFWDWVGGRFSVWSAVGLSVMIAIGKERFTEFLDGARDADQHFLNTPLADNIPVMMGALGFWYGRYFKSPAHAILAYDESLRIFPSYLQQLDMESNGKSIDKNGKHVDFPTGPIIFGGLGNDGQHAYYQWLHQSQPIVPTDFFAAMQSTIDTDISISAALSDHHALLLANCFAQSQAFMTGKNSNQVRSELVAQGLDDCEINALLPYKIFEGNRPSTTFLYPQMTPKILGSLLAFYEHKIFAQGVLWNINSFDQWGVELGKQLANKLIPALLKDENMVTTSQTTGAELMIPTPPPSGIWAWLIGLFASKPAKSDVKNPVETPKKSDADASTLDLIRRVHLGKTKQQLINKSEELTS